MVKIDYTARDFFAIRTALIKTIPEFTPNWTDYNASDLGITLLEMVAYVGDIINAYLDRQANESFLRTAQLRTSVEDLCALIGYSLVSKRAAIVEVEFTASTTGTAVSSGTVISTSGSSPVKFTTVEEIICSTGTGPYTGTGYAIQGTWTEDELLGKGSGESNQSFMLGRKPLVYHGAIEDVFEEQYRVTVEVDGVEWEYVESFIESDGYEQVFTIDVDDDDIAYVRFGDGVNGKIPDVDSVIRADYMVGGGTLGNVGSATITEIVSVVDEDVTAVTNDDLSFGGEDKESIEYARAYAPQYILALDRAVSLEDFETLADKYPGVAITKADNPSSLNITVYMLPENWSSADYDSTAFTVLAANLKNYLEAKAVVGASVTITVPSILNIDFNITVWVEDGYDSTTVLDAVEEAVYAWVNPLEKDEDGMYKNPFNRSMYLSALYEAIESVDGVEGAQVTQFDTDPGTDVENVITSSGAQVHVVYAFTIAAGS